MAFLRQELAIDLGTANTVVFKDDQVVLDEPSIIATQDSLVHDFFTQPRFSAQASG